MAAMMARSTELSSTARTCGVAPTPAAPPAAAAAAAAALATAAAPPTTLAISKLSHCEQRRVRRAIDDQLAQDPPVDAAAAAAVLPSHGPAPRALYIIHAEGRRASCLLRKVGRKRSVRRSQCGCAASENPRDLRYGAGEVVDLDTGRCTRASRSCERASNAEDLFLAAIANAGDAGINSSPPGAAQDRRISSPSPVPYPRISSLK